MLWVGAADNYPLVHWTNAVRAFRWRFECEAAWRLPEEAHGTRWVYACFPSETHPTGGA